MRKITILDRIVLLLSGLIAAYQVVAGVEGFGTLATWAYTFAFGVLLIAGLLMIISGFEILESPLVVVVAAIIPLGIALGLVGENQPRWGLPYLAFAIVGLLLIFLTRYVAPPRLATAVLASVHGVAGLTIFTLPIVLFIQQAKPAHYLLVSLGGALIGIGGLLLAFLKAGKPILPAERIFTLLPWILLFMSLAFVFGLS